MITINPSHDDDGDEASKHKDDVRKELLQNEIIDLISKIPKDKVILLDKIIIELVKSRGGGWI